MKLTPNRKVIALLAAILAVEILAGVGLILLQRSVLEQTRKDLAAKLEEQREGERIAQRLEQLELTVRREEDELAFLERNVSDADYVPTLLRDLERLALATHNRLLGVRPEPRQENMRATSARQKNLDQQTGQESNDPAGGSKSKEEKKEDSAYDALFIRVQMVGGYAQTQAFLQRLTRFPKIIGVEEVQLRPHHNPKQGDSANLLSVELRLKAYLLKEAAALAAPDDSQIRQGAV